MKEFKLIPLNEVEMCVGKTPPSPVKNTGDVVKVGNEDLNVVMKKLLMDEKNGQAF